MSHTLVGHIRLATENMKYLGNFLLKIEKTPCCFVAFFCVVWDDCLFACLCHCFILFWIFYLIISMQEGKFKIVRFSKISNWTERQGGRQS